MQWQKQGHGPVIIGYDCISSLGIELEEQWQRALKGESGISRLSRFAGGPDFPVRIAGQLPDIDQLDYPFLSARQRAMWSSPVFKYALLVVERALARSGITIDTKLAPRVATTFSSAVGGVDALLEADRQWQKSGKLPPPYANPNSCINMVSGKVAMHTGATGPIMSTISACATGLSSLLSGAMLLALGRADVVICGAVDCAVVAPITAGFYTMNGIFIPKKDEEDTLPQEASRPFSVHRRGFVLSEGAGALILCSQDFARAHGLGFSIELAGWGMSSDAQHPVLPFAPTIIQCMHSALVDAGIGPQEVKAVNAHATATRAGDKTEYEALRAVFGADLPPVSANKSIFGHAMGASSAIETIFALRGMEEGLLPPTLNYRPDPDMELDCVAEGQRPLIQEFVMKNAFGFGGCNACAIFRRCA